MTRREIRSALTAFKALLTAANAVASRLKSAVNFLALRVSCRDNRLFTKGIE